MKNIEKFYHESIRGHQLVVDKMMNESSTICRLISLIVEAIAEGKTIFTCGNGGSAAEADHFVGELLGRYKLSRDPLPAVSLSSGIATVTCISNDYDFNQVFTRPLKALGEKGDVLIMYSTSGNSENIRMVGELAREMGIRTFLISGQHYHKWHQEMDGVVRIPSQETARIQECTTILTHVICSAVDDLGTA